MNDETQMTFPPFAPAKPKGSVAAEIDAVVESTFKPKRKRRTAAELEAAGGRKTPKLREATLPLDSLVAFAGLASEEINQVISFCEATNRFPKAARKRIAAAIAQLFS